MPLRGNGGDLLWRSTLPIDEKASLIAGQTPSWTAVLEMEGLFELPEATATTTEQGEGLVAQTCRIQVPVTLDVHASTLGAFQTSTVPGSLNILTGHAAVHGWYRAMYEALILPDDNATIVAALWQAAMAVSLKVALVTCRQMIAIKSIKWASDNALAARYGQEKSPSFIRKLALPLEANTVPLRMEVCSQHNIKFSGYSVTKIVSGQNG